MQRLVKITLRHCNIILKTSGNWFKLRVNKPQNFVTFFFGVNDYTDCRNVIKVVECDVLALHFAINTVIVFCAAGNLCVNSRSLYIFGNFIYQKLYCLLTLCFFLRYKLGYFKIFVGFKISQRQIFKFRLNFPHP